MRGRMPNPARPKGLLGRLVGFLQDGTAGSHGDGDQTIAQAIAHGALHAIHNHQAPDDETQVARSTSTGTARGATTQITGTYDETE